MKEIFIDLGAFDGDTLEAALVYFPDCERYYAFEPLSRNFEILSNRFGAHPKIQLFQAAASLENGQARLFLGKDYGNEGGSLSANKSTNYSDRYEEVATIDFPAFLKEVTAKEVKVILKVDIEGHEYLLFKQLLKENRLRDVGKIFCEWHYDRLSMPKEEHDAVVRDLNRLGFELTGNNHWDEFFLTIEAWKKQGRFIFALKRKWFFLKRSLKPFVID